MDRDIPIIFDLFLRGKLDVEGLILPWGYREYSLIQKFEGGIGREFEFGCSRHASIIFKNDSFLDTSPYLDLPKLKKSLSLVNPFIWRVKSNGGHGSFPSQIKSQDLSPWILLTIFDFCLKNRIILSHDVRFEDNIDIPMLMRSNLGRLGLHIKHQLFVLVLPSFFDFIVNFTLNLMVIGDFKSLDYSIWVLAWDQSPEIECLFLH